MDSETIDKTVLRISKEISNSYPSKETLTVLVINDESIPFALDLVSKIRLDVRLEILNASLYGDHLYLSPLNHNISNTNVLLVSYCGYALHAIKSRLELMLPIKSINFATLIKSKQDKSYHHFLGKTMKRRDLHPSGYGFSADGIWNGEKKIVLKKVKR